MKATPKVGATSYSIAQYSYVHLFVLSLPHILTLLIEPLSSWVDLAIVSRLDQIHTGALSLSLGVLISVGWLFQFLVHGSTADIAKNLESKDELPTRVTSILILAFCLGVVVAYVLHVLQKFFFLKMFAADLDVFDAGKDYYHIRLFGLAWSFLLLAVLGVLRGAQKNMLSLILVFLTTFLNIALTLIFFYPLKMGMFGVGLATSLSFCIGSLFGLGFILKSVTRLEWNHTSSSLQSIFLFTSKNQHLFYRTIFLLAAYFSAKAAASRMGLNNLVAFEIVFQVWTLSAYVLDGFAVTATSRGALEIGKGRMDRWELISKKFMSLGLIFGLIFMGLFWLSQDLVTLLFPTSDVVKDRISEVWWIICFAQPFVAVLYVVDGILFGVEDFKWLHVHMRQGVLGVFAPMIAITLWFIPSLLLLWWAIVGLSLYRLLGGVRRFQQIVYYNKLQ